MWLKKMAMLGSIGFYLYTLAFGIFLTAYLRIPAPFISVLLLLPFVRQPLQPSDYTRECTLALLSLFLYYVIGKNDYKTFFATGITIVVCALYFNYFIGLSKRRLSISVFLFFLFLLLSMLIMVLDHSDQHNIDILRSKMLDTPIEQSPSGLAVAQFTFGYQVAAFTSFVFVFFFLFKSNVVVKIVALSACMAFIFLGMNRSAFVSFAAIVVLFILIYFRAKGLILISGMVLAVFAVYFFVLKNDLDGKRDNILAKNEAKENVEVNRAQLTDANLKIFADYPYGLMFYGKTWDEVTYRNPDFPFGLSSHNAYLMFVTYLGPFVGLALLIALYYRVITIFFAAIKHIHLKENTLLITLLFSFIGVSINALFHNGWILTADGPSLFLYFAIMQGAKISLDQKKSKEIIELEPVE